MSLVLNSRAQNSVFYSYFNIHIVYSMCYNVSHHAMPYFFTWQIYDEECHVYALDLCDILILMRGKQYLVLTSSIWGMYLHVLSSFK